MPCYGPIRAWKSADVNPSGKRSLVFRKDASHSGIPFDIPCGQCIGCKLERSRVWAMRCVHEMRVCAPTGCGSSFLTLTYSEKFLPPNGTLVKRDLQLFMKRLRRERPMGLRFFACGEYGDTSLRPHFHVLLLNTCFPDMLKRSWGLTEQRHETYVSAEASRLWTFGDHVIGEVNFESCAYVTRYCTKVITGDRKLAHYGGREPEFSVMSRRPGLGTAWFNAYYREAYKADTAIINAREVPLNRFYDTKFELSDEGWRLDDIKFCRRLRAMRNKPDNTSRRRQTKERLTKLTIEHFKKGAI